MWFLNSIIVTILIVWFILRDGLGYEVNLVMIHKQLGWIAVILLLGFAQLEYVLNKHFKNTNELLKKILYSNHPEIEVQEQIKKN